MQSNFKYCLFFLSLLAALLPKLGIAQQTCSDFKLSAKKYKVCEQNAVVLELSGHPAGSDLTWNFDNQSLTDNSDSVRFIALNTGKFTPTVRVETPSNLVCVRYLERRNSSQRTEIEVVGKPQELSVETDPTSLCQLGQSVEFKAVNGTPDLKYTWIIESQDGLAKDYKYKPKSSSNSLRHQLNVEGYKRAVLELENTDGCKQTILIDSVVYAMEMPDLDFSIKDQGSCDKKTVDFIPNFILPNGADITWTFENGIPATSNRLSPKGILFDGEGRYDVKVEVSHPSGCTAENEVKEAVVVGSQKDIDIRISKAEICSEEQIRLQLIGASTGDGAINWDYPSALINRDLSTQTTRFIRYQRGGLKDVSLTLNAGGCVSEVAYEDTINVNEVIAEFTSSVPCYCEPLSVDFSNQTQLTNPSDSLSYLWTVRDENGSLVKLETTKDLQHNFGKMGTFEISLTARSRNGCEDVQTQELPFKPLRVEFITGNTNLCLGDEAAASIIEESICQFRIEDIIWKLYDADSNLVDSIQAQEYKANLDSVGVYSLELTITNEAGCKYVTRQNDVFNVYKLETEVTIDDEFICIGDQVELESKNTPFDIATNNDWLIIDPSTGIRFTGTGKNLGFAFSEAGTYDVQLIASKTPTCSDTVRIPQQFKVSGAKAEIITDLDEACVPFTDTLTQNIIYNIHHSNNNDSLSYEWSTSPGSGISLSNPTGDSTEVEITESNYYTINLKLTNSEGCVTNFSERRAYKAGVVANFSHAGTACKDVPYKVNNSSFVNPISYKWLVDSPSTDIRPRETARSPRFVFKTPGRYRLRMEATNRIGCIDTVTKYVDVINFEYNFTSPQANSFLCAPALVEFNATQTNVDSFVWSFGNGQSLGIADTQVAHYYDIIGVDVNDEFTFDVQLVAISRFGCFDTLTKKEYIQVFGPQPKFLIQPNKGTKKVEAEFINLNEGVSYFLFDYGDQTISVDSNQMQPHTYTISDTSKESVTYYPKMVAFDERGCSREFRGPPVKVFNSAIPDFEADTLMGCDSLTVQLTNYTKFADSFQWFLNDIDTPFSTERHPIIRLGKGNHSITLSAYNIDSNRAQTTKEEYIWVNEKPNVAIEFDRDFYCVGKQVSFRDQTVGDNNIVAWKWDFNHPNNQDTSVIRDPIFSYDAPGTYSIFLAVKDQAGCENSKVFTDTVTVDFPTQLSHEGLGYVSRDGDDFLELFVSDEDRSGLFEFVFYRVNNGDSNEFFPLGETALDTLGPGLYRSAFQNNKEQFFVKAINQCRDTLRLGELHRPMNLEVSTSTGSYTPLIQWTPYEGWDSLAYYQVYRKEFGEDDVLVATVQPTDTFAIDSSVCNSFYEYYTIAVDNLRPYRSLSNLDTISPNYEPPTGAVDLLVSTVEENEFIRTNWRKHEHPGIKEYIVSRWDPNFGYVVNHKRLDDTVYVDSIDVFVGRDIYKYKVRAVDFCFNESDTSNQGNNIVLVMQRDGDDMRLAWNDYETWPDGEVNYELQRRQKESGTFEGIFNSSTEFEYTDGEIFINEDEIFQYRIKASYQGLTSYSNITQDLPEARIFIPNAFSPNGDGLNDKFSIVGSAVQNGSEVDFDNFKLVIFSRWGQKIYESNDITEGWDGTLNGEQVPIGSYRYHAELRDKAGLFYYRVGRITLIR